VLLRRRFLRIGWLTQIPHHFGCKFDCVSKSWSSQRIFVSFFHLPKLFRYVKIFCKQRFTNNDGINSVIFSKSLLAECIVNAKGLLKLILHFFLTYSYFLHSFFEFFITIYNRHICSLYHSLVHFTISCTQWRHLCVVRLHHICEAPRHFLFTFSRPLCLKLE